MVVRVATMVFGVLLVLFTIIASHGTAGGPPACGPEPYSCLPAPCAPPSCPPPTCGPPSPFGMGGNLCGGIIGACTSICGACIGIPAAVMSCILAPPPARPMCPPPACPPPRCAPQVCAPPACIPPMCEPYACPPARITKCKPVSCAPTYAPYPVPGGRVPLMMRMPRADCGPTLPPVGGMLAQAIEMPFRLISGVLSRPFGSYDYGPFASPSNVPTFGGYW